MRKTKNIQMQSEFVTFSPILSYSTLALLINTNNYSMNPNSYMIRLDIYVSIIIDFLNNHLL